MPNRKTGPADVPVPLDDEPEPVPDYKQRAAPAPGSAWPGPGPSAEHRNWVTSDGGPPVEHEGFEPGEPVRGVSN